MTDEQKERLLSAAQVALDRGFSFENIIECILDLKLRKVTFCSVFVSCLVKVLRFAQAHKLDVIYIKDIGLTPVEYSRFNDLVRFGFAYIPEERGHGEYGLYTDKIQKFLEGTETVSTHFWANPVDKSVTLSDSKIKLDQVRSVASVMNQYGIKMSDYSTPSEVTNG